MSENDPLLKRVRSIKNTRENEWILGISDVESTEPIEQENNRCETRRQVQTDAQASIDANDIIQEQEHGKRNNCGGVRMINTLPRP